MLSKLLRTCRRTRECNQPTFRRRATQTTARQDLCALHYILGALVWLFFGVSFQTAPFDIVGGTDRAKVLKSNKSAGRYLKRASLPSAQTLLFCTFLQHTAAGWLLQREMLSVSCGCDVACNAAHKNSPSMPQSDFAGVQFVRPFWPRRIHEVLCCFAESYITKEESQCVIKQHEDIISNNGAFSSAWCDFGRNGGEHNRSDK